MESQDGPPRNIPHQTNPYYDRPFHASQFMPRCGALPLHDTTVMKGARCRIARASLAAL
jgi:hypothetical protein